MDVNITGSKKYFIRKGMQLTYLSVPKDTHNVFYNFVYKKAPHGTFKNIYCDIMLKEVMICVPLKLLQTTPLTRSYLLKETENYTKLTENMNRRALESLQTAKRACQDCLRQLKGPHRQHRTVSLLCRTPKSP